MRAWHTKNNELISINLSDEKTALSLWKTGQFSIVADNINEHIPFVGELMKSIRLTIGYESDLDCNMSCNVYCSPPGVGTIAHFDEQEVVIVQILGSKTWRFAPNEHVKHPSSAYFGTVSSALKMQMKGNSGLKMPSRASQVTLNPGSVLFLPRGTWHQTKAESSGSLALTLTFVTRTWAGLFSRFIYDAALMHADLREPVLPKKRGYKDKFSEKLHIVQQLVKAVERNPDLALGLAQNKKPLKRK